MKNQGMIIVVAMVAATVAQADMLAMWNNDNLTGTETNNAVDTVAPGVSAGDFAQSYQWNNDAAPWPNSMWSFIADVPSATNLATAIALDRYYTFAVSPDADKQVSYSNVAARVTLMSNGGVGTSVTLVLMSSATGFNDGNEIGSFVAVHNPADGVVTDNGLIGMDISGVSALQDVTSEVEFRLYTVLNDPDSGRLAFGHIFWVDDQDDIRVDGTLIPEPTTLGLLVFVSVGMLWVRKNFPS